jgi:NAD(P)H-dependent FMN reductase
MSPLLENVIDWYSRPVDGQNGRAPYRNKVVVVMSASPGGFGGLRALPRLRPMLSGIGAIVLLDQVAVLKVHEAHEVFAPQGSMANEQQQATIEALRATLASHTGEAARAASDGGCLRSGGTIFAHRVNQTGGGPQLLGHRNIVDVHVCLPM